MICKTRPSRDSGLQVAIAAAGSKARLAVALGVKPQSVQKWSRVPADRLLAVEAVTGIDRSVLRPDLYQR